jgi:putative tryptophan/tyrosine transport system substrate-binding protein
VHFVPVRATGDIQAALAAVEQERSQGLIVLPDRVFLHERSRLMSFATEHHLPGIYAYRELVEAGGLMSYGPSYADLHRRAAVFVDKLLKGVKAAEIPVEQPTKFELVVNLKAASLLGLTVPPTLVARADEVIE